MSATALIDSFAALLPGDDDETATVLAMAAIYALAVRREISPREVVDSLWISMPTGERWLSLRDSLVAAIETE